MPTCRMCGKTKPRSQFHRDPRLDGGLSTKCKSCKKIYDATYYQAHKARIDARSRRWEKEHPVEMAIRRKWKRLEAEEEP